MSAHAYHDLSVELHKTGVISQEFKSLILGYASKAAEEAYALGREHERARVAEHLTLFRDNLVAMENLDHLAMNREGQRTLIDALSAVLPSLSSNSTRPSWPSMSNGNRETSTNR